MPEWYSKAKSEHNHREAVNKLDKGSDLCIAGLCQSSTLKEVNSKRVDCVYQSWEELGQWDSVGCMRTTATREAKVILSRLGESFNPNSEQVNYIVWEIGCPAACKLA